MTSSDQSAVRGDAGTYCYDLARELFPICRSLTGPGVRETLYIIKRELPELEIKAVLSGTNVLDWTVPDEWQIRSAFIEDEAGNRVVDFSEHNLHVVGYSTAVDTWMSLDELQSHLYSIPDQPEAIPYVTSYYSRRWGFCLTERVRSKLKDGRYHAFIDADLKPGVLNYGELKIKGQTDKEIFISTYVCHPSMANNELSGPVVSTALARIVSAARDFNKYSYRFVFIPETIGSITYIAENIVDMRGKIAAGYNVSCVGDDRAYSFLPSRNGDSISDRAAKHVLKHIDPTYVSYTWLDRGSDERQYCAPGVDLPIASIMRTKYGAYPEYHTSLDDLDLISPAGLAGAVTALLRAIEVIEGNVTYQATVLCEPQMGRRGLYPTLSQRGSANDVGVMMDLLSYCDGQHSLLDIAEVLDRPFGSLLPTVATLEWNGLITRLPD